MIIDIPDERVKKIITDYLSDKEEDNLACCGGRVSEKDLSEYLSKAKEASKGECVATKLFSAWATTEEQRKKWDDMAVKHLKKNCACHPPQQEESRGECTHDWNESGEMCRKCHLTYRELTKDKVYFVDETKIKYKPQLKEESPKEDEWEDDFEMDFYKNYYGKHGQGFKKLRDLTIDYIKANFVSKSKLSKYVQDGIDECNEPGMRIGGVAVLREMQMAFRLEYL